MFSETILYLISEHGYAMLFAVSFLAATIFPLSSEFVLSILLLNNYNSAGVLMVGTVGNVLGAVVNYGLGLWGNRVVLEKWLRLSPREMKAAEKRFQKYGLYSLCLAWAPIIGDPLTVVAGLLKVNFGVFLLIVTLVKFLRYLFIAVSIGML